MSKLIWALRQLVPTTYRTRYRDADGRPRYSVWRMWAGRVFAHDDLVLADGNGGN